MARPGDSNHSTKATRADDKRLSIGRRLIATYIKDNVTDEKIKDLLESLYKKGKEGNDRCAKLYLSYVAGMPKESLDITTDGEKVGFNLSNLSDKELNILLKLHGRNDTDTGS